MSHVKAPSRETAAAGPGLDQATSFVVERDGQDVSLRAGSQDNHPPFRFAETDVLDRVDPLATPNRARDLRRLFIAAVAWTVNAVSRWNTRHEQRRYLQELPDYLLKDIGIRRDQIDAVVSGSLKRDHRSWKRPRQRSVLSATERRLGRARMPRKSADA
ncbi:MAG: DUF1127 domain-containing protein [Alphaproteobacteria bacterium]|nr:DUF1127 domain-containing protein [Alphaproteobacteria bacterium]